MKLQTSSSQRQYIFLANELASLDSSKKYRVLELGAATEIIKSYLPENFEYKSADIDSDHDYKFNLDAGKFPIQNNMFDIIICFETLEHIMYPDRVMKEIVRIAKPDAIFFLSLPNEYNLLQRIYFLLGKKTMFDEPFQVVEKHLHIHKPRVQDILGLFSRYLAIKKVHYMWQSLHSTDYLPFSFLFRFLDRILTLLAKVQPSLFSRLVIVKAVKKNVRNSK